MSSRSQTAGADVDGLTYPFGETLPGFGEVAEVRPGYGWTRFDLGEPLVALNAWVVDDGDDATVVVDAGLATASTKAAWERLIETRRRQGRPVRRLILTHHHPDHAGMAAWVENRLGVPVSMPIAELEAGQRLMGDLVGGIDKRDLEFWRECGWSRDEMEEVRPIAFAHFEHEHDAPPRHCDPLENGDVVELSGRQLQVITARGHSPALACLWDARAQVVIVGDQVLPEITSGLVVWHRERDEDLLGDWLASAARLRELPRETLVLPAHGRPYVGLHQRLSQLEAVYARRLARLEAGLTRPRTVSECFEMLFGRTPDAGNRLIMTGEARTYLNRLEREGRVTRSCQDGVLFWRARPA